MNEIKPRRPSAAEPLSNAAFEAAIRAVGTERYHDKHVFPKLVHGGKLNKGQGPGLGAEPLLLPRGAFLGAPSILQTMVPLFQRSRSHRPMATSRRRTWLRECNAS